MKMYVNVAKSPLPPIGPIKDDSPLARLAYSVIRHQLFDYYCIFID